MAGIADIRFLTRPVRGYAGGALVGAASPVAETSFMDVAQSSDVSDKKLQEKRLEEFKKRNVKTRRITRNILGLGKKITPVGIITTKLLDEVLTNFIKKGATVAERNKVFDLLGIERIKERPRFYGPMLKILFQKYYPGKKVPEKVAEIKKWVSEWKGKKRKGRSESKLEDHLDPTSGYHDPGYKETVSIGVTKTKKATADEWIKKLKKMSEAERTKEMLKITDQGVLHRVKSHFPTGAAKLEKWSTPEAKKIYEIVRKELIEKKGLDPSEIHQAHGLEEMWYKLFPKKLRKELPFYRVPTENLINQFHDKLNKALYRSIAKREDPRWLKKKIKQEKFDDIKTLDKGIESMKRMIKDLKLETPVLSKKTKSVDWITPYEPGTSFVHKNIQFKKNYDTLVKRLSIKQKGLKKISPVLERLRHGGVASISHLTRPI